MSEKLPSRYQLYGNVSAQVYPVNKCSSTMHPEINYCGLGRKGRGVGGGGSYTCWHNVKEQERYLPVPVLSLWNLLLLSVNHQRQRRNKALSYNTRLQVRQALCIRIGSAKLKLTTSHRYVPQRQNLITKNTKNKQIQERLKTGENIPWRWIYRYPGTPKKYLRLKKGNHEQIWR